jgi:hypothetical protein
MMPRVAAVVFAISAGLTVSAGLSGCSALDPYPTAPQGPVAGVNDGGPRVAICYDMVTSSRQTVQQAAQGECAPNTVAARVDIDWKLDYCPLLLPARATFVCKPKT